MQGLSGLRHHVDSTRLGLEPWDSGKDSSSVQWRQQGPGVLSPACTSMGNARAPSRCHLRWHACAISYDSESAPCKLLDDFGFSLLEAPNLKLRTRANGFFWFRKHLHRLKCNRERCTRPNSSADAKAASTPMANGTTFNLKLPAHCRLLRLWLPKSNHVRREDQGYENEDRDQARTLQT